MAAQLMRKVKADTWRALPRRVPRVRSTAVLYGYGLSMDQINVLWLKHWARTA